MHEHGPYQDEGQASAAAVAAVPPAPGRLILSPAQRIELLRLALDGAGVETSPYEDRQAAWLTEWSDHLIAIIARWVQTAHEAGRASAMEGSVTQWGLRYESGEKEPVVMQYPDEEEARRLHRELTDIDAAVRRTVVTRQAGPWKEAD